MSAFTVGDVVRYSREERHCREGQAIAETRGDRIILIDTFWGSGMDAHVLTEAELATAEFQFNLRDYRPVTRNETWADFHPSNRVEVTHQHGLQRARYVRIGAEPDMSTRIENAKERVEEAERELEYSTARLKWCKEELVSLLEKAVA